jgi:hypothetical protein
VLANATSEGWRNIVEGRDPDDLCSKADVKALQQRSVILCQAYRLALSTWMGPTNGLGTKCCEEHATS